MLARIGRLPFSTIYNGKVPGGAHSSRLPRNAAPPGARFDPYAPAWCSHPTIRDFIPVIRIQNGEIFLLLKSEEKMELTVAYKQTGPCCWYHLFLKQAVSNVLIRDFLLCQLFSCLDKISYIEWALDSDYILCCLYKRLRLHRMSLQEVWSLSQPEWTCKIDQGPAGIAYARCGVQTSRPHSYHIRFPVAADSLVTSEHSLCSSSVAQTRI